MNGCNPYRGEDDGTGCAPGTGSILILALWTLFFLGALALAVGAYVTAGVNLAVQLKGDTIAGSLARSGVERAIVEVESNVTNWNAFTEDRFQSDAAVFCDNSSLPGGTFTVRYTFVSTNAGQTVTNFGVIRERSKTNLNSASPQVLVRLFREKGGLGDAAATALATNVVHWRGDAWGVGKKKLAPVAGNGYPSVGFGSLHELLLVEGMTDELFTRLEPFVTVFANNCYSGTSEGCAMVRDGGGGWRVTGRCEILFVYDRDRNRLVSWHER